MSMTMGWRHGFGWLGEYGWKEVIEVLGHTLHTSWILGTLSNVTEEEKALRSSESYHVSIWYVGEELREGEHQT